jgi:hypothetical protein
VLPRPAFERLERGVDGAGGMDDQGKPQGE